MFEIPWWTLISQPFFEGAVKPLQLAEGLGVVGRRVDHLHTEVGEAGLEDDFCAVESPSETQSVVREHLTGQPVTGGCNLEGIPGQLTTRSLPDQSSQQIPGMVVDEINHPRFGAVTEEDLGGVDLPQIVGDLPFEPFIGSWTPRGWGTTSPLRRNA